MARGDFVEKYPAAMLFFIQLYAARTGAAVPQTGVAFIAVGGFVPNQNHVLFPAGDVHFHFSPESGLHNVPLQVGVRFGAVKKGTAARPEFAEIEFIIPPLVVELAQ